MPARTLACVVLVLAGEARAETWRADPSQSALTVHVAKRGLFSAFAHDHDFAVTDWSARVSLDLARPGDAAIELVAAAGSLHDRQRKLSEKDRAEVDARTAGPEVLDAKAHPEITFRSEGLEVAPGATAERFKGTAAGTLTLRGRSKPVKLSIEAERAGAAWRVRGTARLRQTDFGIRPFSAVAGTVGVEDEVRIDLVATLAPAKDAGALGQGP